MTSSDKIDTSFDEMSAARSQHNLSEFSSTQQVLFLRQTNTLGALRGTGFLSPHKVATLSTKLTLKKFLLDVDTQTLKSGNFPISGRANSCLIQEGKGATGIEKYQQ